MVAQTKWLATSKISKTLTNLYDVQDSQPTGKNQVDSIANALVDFRNSPPNARTFHLLRT